MDDKHVIFEALVLAGHTPAVAWATLANYTYRKEVKAYEAGFRDGQSAGPAPATVDELIEND